MCYTPLEMSWLDYLYYAIWLGSTAMALWNLLRYRREPYSTLTWILFVLLIPIIGPTIFLFFGPQRLEKQARKRDQEIEASSKHSQFLMNLRKESKTGLSEGLSPRDIPILTLADQISDYPATAGNRVELYTDPQETLQRIVATIDSAKSYVHLEYYIITNDEVTTKIFEHLILAAKRGVEVRVLYDSFGSLFLKRIHFRKLLQNGVKVAGFMPFTRLPHRFNLHFRNHRKILVVDGVKAFTGGTNLGREYLGKRNTNQWHDSTIEVAGPVCLALQDVFARDWHFTTQEDLLEEKYYPRPQKDGDSLVQAIESGPNSEFASLHQMVFMALNSAEKNLAIMTPYFVPDASVLSSLISAGLKGVDVRLILPAKSDAPLVQMASRSFYEELLEAGVKIYEYQPRILHAKLMVIDGHWTILGSGNMDVRSFKLNFELNLLVHGTDFATQIEKVLADDLEQSKEIFLEQFRERPLSRKILENFFRLFTPII